MYFRPLNSKCAFMNVQVINKSKHPLPAYATELSAGMDIRANLSEPITLAPLQRCLVPTGIYIALPQGFEAQVRPVADWPSKRVLPCSTLRERLMRTIVEKSALFWSTFLPNLL